MNKPKLWTFGCSHTQLIKVMAEEDFEAGHNSSFVRYLNLYNNNPPLGWSQHLAKDLDLHLMNMGAGSSSNQQIFSRFTQFMNQIEDRDVLIIQWSDTVRFRTVGKDGNFVSIFPGGVDENSPYLGMLLNRENPIWVDEVFEYSKIILEWAKLKNIKILFWFMPLYKVQVWEELKENWVHFQDDNAEEWEPDRIYNAHDWVQRQLQGKAKIKHEVDIDDEHFGEQGNLYLSKLILNNYNRLYKDE